MLSNIVIYGASVFMLFVMGSTLNRFSKDIGKTDQILPNYMYEFLTLSMTTLTTILIVSIINFYVLLFMVPVFIGFILLRNYHVRACRSVTRLEAATKSPVFTHVSSSIEGLSTIRAFGLQHIFEREFNEHQNAHTEAFFIFISLSRWLEFRMGVLSALFNTIVVFAGVVSSNSLSSGMFGMSILYSISLIGLFRYAITRSNDIEIMMTSAERILEYAKLEPEAPLHCKDDDSVDPNWPNKGVITINRLNMNYSSEGGDKLKDISFKIENREKIGIVGRTGAGKSSLISMLFRLTESRGGITIDGVDTTKLGLNKLRSHISIIPQDPILFVGSVRENLDPFNIHSEMEIWNVLMEVQLKELIFDHEGQLDAMIKECGSNFSIGERQLFCLARALLNDNKILIIDEATANVDTRTDQLIQKTIKEKFAEKTILTIAHRLNTVIGSDKIMVMNNGEIKEFDNPHLLLQNTEGHLYALIEQCGVNERNNLHKIAENAYNEKKE